MRMVNAPPKRIRSVPLTTPHYSAVLCGALPSWGLGSVASGHCISTTPRTLREYSPAVPRRAEVGGEYSLRVRLRNSA